MSEMNCDEMGIVRGFSNAEGHWEIGPVYEPFSFMMLPGGRCDFDPFWDFEECAPTSACCPECWATDPFEPNATDCSACEAARDDLVESSERRAGWSTSR